MTRRTLFRRLALGATLPSYAFGIEPRWLDLTFSAVPMPGLAAPVRILHLADFHVSSFVPFSLIERAVHMGLEAKPDIICVTGDFITTQAPFDRAEYLRILRKLSARAPVYASLGNHDGGPWAARHSDGYQDTSVVRELLAASGFRLLHNRSEVVKIKSRKLRMAGVGDLWNGEVDPPAAFSTVEPRLPTVLLAHNPDTKDLVAERPWELMLCGHTHGGQILVPVIGTRFVPVRDKRFISGLKHWNGRSIYITRGVGNLGGVRVNCRPEVSVLTLTSPPPALNEQRTV